MTVGTYGTLCWKYNLTAIDGAAYLICATDTTLRVKNGDQYTDTPLAADECNGLQGTFKEIKGSGV